MLANSMPNLLLVLRLAGYREEIEEELQGIAEDIKRVFGPNTSDAKFVLFVFMLRRLRALEHK